MLQDFRTEGERDAGVERLAALRAEMARRDLDAVLIPRADAHQGEYVAPRDMRLAWLTGFTGSAGIAAVTATEAAIFVDGRYKVQVKNEVAAEFAPQGWPETKPGDWLAERLPESAVVGFDPWLHTAREIESLERAFRGKGIALQPVPHPVDAIWPNRPGPPQGEVTLYPHRLAGQSRGEKCDRIAADLRAAGAAWAVLTLPDSIAWLLNIRGSDIPRVPIAQCFALVEAEGARVSLFIDRAKLDGTGDALADLTILPPDGLVAALSALCGPVRVDKGTAPWIVSATLKDAGIEVAWGDDPCLIPKACKTGPELAATRQAHLRDAGAMCRFLCWLDGVATEILADDRQVTEIDVVRALEAERHATGALLDISFETIAGSGPNGAIVHYRVTEATDRRLVPGDLLLVDSGGQYLDGTTDITRTIPIGPPDAEQIACFTRVLKGMVAISRARWPKGLAGRDLDALARAPLWRAGQDYDHGTGHGVGVYLSVHEGPQRISRLGETPLRAGMIVSNEPGYYREGAWGIRIENLVAVEPAPDLETADPGRDMLSFETLTWAPIDRRLIDAAALSPGERAWIDAYHAGVAERMAGRLDAPTAEWLGRSTAPL